MRIAVDFKCMLASCHSCAYCGALCFCEEEWSSVSKPCQLGWASTVGGEIWARNKLNLADTFSFPNMLPMSSGRQTAVKWFGIKTLFKHLEETGCSGWLAEMIWLVFLPVTLVTHYCPLSGCLGATLGMRPQNCVPFVCTKPATLLVAGSMILSSLFPQNSYCVYSQLSTCLMKLDRMVLSFFRSLSFFWHCVNQLLDPFRYFEMYLKRVGPPLT